jgi:NADPH-dependent 2,4-dienoyl-CoA reductase/sulfur reductase-like enzyme
VVPRGIFVIVGASLCGATAATVLREDGFDGRIVLIGAEDHPPYERPPLSKEYLRGDVPFGEASVHALVDPPSPERRCHSSSSSSDRPIRSRGKAP